MHMLKKHILIALLFSLSACATTSTVPHDVIEGNGRKADPSAVEGWVKFCEQHPTDRDCKLTIL